jgi:predicted kinase
MLVGLPATGKSYLARLLAERLGADVVQTDAVRKAMFRQPRYTGPEHAAVYAESHRRIKRRLRAGRTVIFDATNLEENKRQAVYRAADEANARLFIVASYAPCRLVRQRLASRGAGLDPLDRSDADWAVYHKLGRAEPIQHPHILVNTTIDLRQVVELIATRLEDR